MKLLTHNMLQCHVKGCEDSSKNFPLQLENVKLEIIETDQNTDFLSRMIHRIDYPALVSTCQSLNINTLPQAIPEDYETNEEFLSNLHKCLLETNVKEGKMVCRGCGHVYVIEKSVPNMLLSETEI